MIIISEMCGAAARRSVSVSVTAARTISHESSVPTALNSIRKAACAVKADASRVFVFSTDRPYNSVIAAAAAANASPLKKWPWVNVAGFFFLSEVNSRRKRQNRLSASNLTQIKQALLVLLLLC